MARNYKTFPISINVSASLSLGRFENKNSNFDAGKPDMRDSDLFPELRSKNWDICPLVLRHDELRDGSLEFNEVLIGVSQSKNITKTIVNGLNGTIKEYVSDGDLTITINLGIVATDDQGWQTDDYPEAGVRDVVDALSIKDSLEVYSPFLTDIFGVNKMVITGYTINQETHSNRQFISISAISDLDYVIKEEL